MLLLRCSAGLILRRAANPQRQISQIIRERSGVLRPNRNETSSGTFSTTTHNSNTNRRMSAGAQFIPALPPPVKGWPSFWAIKREVEEHLYPLYARGWGVNFLARSNYTSDNDRYVAHLTTEYSFANFSCASQFIADLSTLAEEEKHHPSRISLQNGKRPILTLHVLTDSALRPRWNEEDPDADPPLSRRVPGITRRDLRYAVLLEQLYDQYYKDGRALEPRGQKLKHHYDRPTWEYLVSRFVRSSLSLKPMLQKEESEPLLQLLAESEKETAEVGASTAKLRSTKHGVEVVACPACGGAHRIQDCTARSQYPPPTLCYLCLEPHWWLDCPERQSPQASPS